MARDSELDILVAEEAQQRSDAIEGRLSEIVEECEEVGEDPSYLFSMFFPGEMLDAIHGESE